MATTLTVKKGRKDCQYTREEREIFNPFKKEYRSQTTPQQRGQIFRSKILPAIFDYWANEGPGSISSEELEERVIALGKWFANNWRPYTTVKGSKSTFKVTRQEIVWRTHQGEVEEEMKKLLNVDILDSSTQAYFQVRTRAAKIVFDRMNAEKKEEMEKVVEKTKVMGNPVDIKQRLAEKTSSDKVKKWSEKCWLEMGLYTMTFFGYFRADGKVVVDIHENMAGQVGLGTEKFTRVQHDRVKAMKLQFADYIKGLRRDQVQPVLAPSIEPEVKSYTSITPEGYPLLLYDSFDVKKADLEHIMREYLSRHYKIASGQATTHVPYGRLEANTLAYVPAQYMPDSNSIRDPRNMNKRDLERFLDHIKRRQDLYGAEDAFRFSHYFNRKSITQAIYPPPTTLRTNTVSPQKTKPRSNKSRNVRRAQKASALPANHIPTDTNSLTCNSLSPTVSEPMVVINQGQRDGLLPLGVRFEMPINGPNDGPPQYLIPESLVIHSGTAVPIARPIADDIPTPVNDPNNPFAVADNPFAAADNPFAVADNPFDIADPFQVANLGYINEERNVDDNTVHGMNQDNVHFDIANIGSSNEATNIVDLPIDPELVADEPKETGQGTTAKPHKRRKMADDLALAEATVVFGKRSRQRSKKIT